MLETPKIVQTRAQPTAAIRLKIPRAEIRNVMGPGIKELMTTVASQGLTPTGPWMTRHLSFPPDAFDFEICVPVAGKVTPAGRVQPSELPAATVARAVYRGGYEGLPTAWPELDGWVKTQGLKPRVDLWEVYSTGPESGPDASQWRTELNRPIAVD